MQILNFRLGKRSSVFAAGGAVAFALVFGALTWGKHTDANASATAASAAIPVGVALVRSQNTRLWMPFSGHLVAVDSAAIRPEVSGRITEIRFRDGALVKAGEVLVVIDPQPYQAAVARGQAHLASARTKADFAKLEFERAQNMIKSEAIAQRIFDERANDSRVAQADVLAAEAELKQASIDLDHAYVKAPIAGRVGRPEVTVGNLVQSGPNAPVLTTVVSNNAIYADFDVDEQTYLRSVRSSTSTQANERAIPVALALPVDQEHVYQGTIYSFDNQINTGTGTIRARARFANDDGRLVPGMFVSVRLADREDENLLIVPERAIGTDQSKKFVFVVGPANKVVFREVELGPVAGEGERVVRAGLASGEKVIVDGVQHVQPDVIVDPKVLESGVKTASNQN